MELKDSEADAQFRKELRVWLADVVPSLPTPPDPRDRWASRRFDENWQRLQYDAGYAGIAWPKAHGGRGATPTEHLIFLEELARADAPDVGCGFVGQGHAGPTLIAEGSDEQRAEHLPGILDGTKVWCQGFSEPGAGSDLAGLRTRAVRDGDEYVVTGQKIWTSFAQVADYCELLVRTDPEAPKHKGISWLILPMSSPGIEVRELVTLQGEAEFAETYLDEVRVPVANRVGAENDGWRVAMVTLSFERGTAFVPEMLESLHLVEDLARLSERLRRGRGPAWEDAGIRRELGTVAAELDALWALTKRNVTRGESGTVPIVGGSSFKLYYADVRHRLGDLAMRVLDQAGLVLEDLPDLTVARHVEGSLHAFAVSIAAGSSQVQRNILAERVLGLPKER
jgi:alkylation response protein AidB-like acyl-CoA dehydrogenase